MICPCAGGRGACPACQPNLFKPVFAPKFPAPMRHDLDVDQMSIDELRAEVRRLRALLEEGPR